MYNYENGEYMKENKNNKKNKFFIVSIIVLIFLFVIFVIIEKVLNTFNLSFRFWFKSLVINIFFILSIVLLVLFLIKKRVNIKKVFISISFMLVIFIIFKEYILFIISAFSHIYGLDIEEYEVDINHEKKVVYVQRFWDTSIKIHDYYNKILCGYDYETEFFDGILNINELEEYLNEKNNEKILYNNQKN